jgi:hypothetical protein
VSTGHSVGCSSDLATSVLVNAVMSPLTPLSWAGKDSLAFSDDVDTCGVRFYDMRDGIYCQYVYQVQKSPWLITALRVMYGAGFVYDASYRYALHDSLWVLEQVALFRDTTLGSGGMRFSNIRYAAAGVAGKHGARHAVQPFYVLRANGVTAQSGVTLSVLDLVGRLLPQSGTAPAATGVRLIVADRAGLRQTQSVVSHH